MSTNNDEPQSPKPFYYKKPQAKNFNYIFAEKDFKIQVVRNHFKPRTISGRIINLMEQVLEGGPAEKAGVKLGDTIVKINDTDANKMMLGRAHKMIKQSGENLKISVKNFEDEESEEHTPSQEHDIHFGGKKPSVAKKPSDAPPRGTLEQQLRAMQRKLSEIADIPIKIQSTLIEISKKFETILPTEEPEINYQILSETDQTESDNYDDDEDEEYENHALDSLSLDYKNEDDENRKGLLRDFFENDSNNSCETESEDEIEEEVVPEIPRELTEEEKLKLEKQLKLQELEKSWPWCAVEKKVYKRSNCHLVPSTALIKNKIKQLNEKELISFYTRNPNRIGN